MPHHHSHIDQDAGDARIFWAVLINLALTVAEVIGGILSGSLALIADAIHNLSDALSLIIAFIARRIARRPPDAEMTFGYGRAEIVAALMNYTTLILVGLYLIYEAGLRFFNPTEIDGWLVIVVSAFALIVDAATALLTYALAKKSLNIRAAFLHNLADALGSIAVVFSGTLILLHDWRMIDPFVTLLIAGYILWISFREIGAVIRIVMLASPPHLDARAVLDEIAAIDGVTGVHHLHLWQMQESENALDAHLVIDQNRWNDSVAIKQEVKADLLTKFGIVHSTLELECPGDACRDPLDIGHRSPA